MARTMDRRERRRQATVEEIKDTARRQIAQDGATSLSLGAIARAMGMTPPALYRYFENRDALVVALVVASCGGAEGSAESTLRKVLDRGELFPHKTTCFHPKLFTGLVLRDLEG